MRIISAWGLTLAALALVGAGPAAATTGWGCYRVNTGPSDPLNVRGAPEPGSPVVTQIDSSRQPIISLNAGQGPGADLAEVHRAELARCLPERLPLGARYCPVTLYGESTHSGWAKRRFLDHSECP